MDEEVLITSEKVWEILWRAGIVKNHGDSAEYPLVARYMPDNTIQYILTSLNDMGSAKYKAEYCECMEIESMERLLLGKKRLELPSE